MKQLRIKKQFGNWYYIVERPNEYNDLDAPLYTLYNDKKEFAGNFAYYGDMKYYIETGIMI